MDDDRWFAWLAAVAAPDPEQPERAPARLEAQVYSALIRRLSSTAPLLGLEETRAAGRGLCVFEEAVAAVAISERIGSMNPCRVCHARVLAERLERAPIFWPHCPYAEFHRRKPTVA